MNIGTYETADSPPKIALERSGSKITMLMRDPKMRPLPSRAVYTRLSTEYYLRKFRLHKSDRLHITGRLLLIKGRILSCKAATQKVRISGYRYTSTIFHDTTRLSG